MADSRPLRVAILARSVHPLHGVGGLERHVYDLLHHLARRGAHDHADHEAGDDAGDPRRRGRRVAAVRRRVGPDCPEHRAVRDVPRRGPARHDGHRSRHGLSGLRLARRACRRGDRACRRGRRRARARRQRPRLRAGPPPSGEPRAVRVQPAGARGIRRHASRLRAAEAAGLHPAPGGGAALRAGRRRDPRHGSRAGGAGAHAPRRRSGARPRGAERGRSRDDRSRPRVGGRHRGDAAGAARARPPASGCCSASAGSKRTRASTCWRPRSPS